MSKKRKLLLILLVVVLIAGLGVGGYFGINFLKISKLIEGIEEIELDVSAKNVVLMIGDGMGAEHIETAAAYYGAPTYIESLAVCDGTVATFSKNNLVTDSAAAATALSCGVKVKNGQIAYNKGKNLETLCEYAKTLNKKTGVIATETLSGATPACFSAHATNRNKSKDIINSQITSGVNLFMGAGAEEYNKYTAEITLNGYSYTNTFGDLYEYKASEKIMATFDSISTDIGEDATPTLAEMSEFALEYLSEASGDDGFFLMIEGSHIDKKSHSNDMAGMLDEFKGFDKAVKAVTEWANEDTETMVIVTADHETGGLKYDSQTKEQINDSLFSRTGHTNADVRIFFYGITVPVDEFQDKRIDNTAVSSIIRQTIYNYYKQ